MPYFYQLPPRQIRRVEANNDYHSFRRQGTLKMKQNDDHHQLKVQARNNDVVVVEDRNVSSANGGRGDDFQPRQNTDDCCWRVKVAFTSGHALRSGAYKLHRYMYG